MHIPSAILHLYPAADPLRDFVVQDDGPTPVLREGAEEKGRVRYEIKTPEEGEEPIEGVHYRFGIDYNLLTDGEDYDLVDKGPYIAYWGLEAPQPTEVELEAAWDELQAQPAPEPPETLEQKTARLESENSDLRSRLGDIELALADVFAGGGE
ncbi:Phage-like element PBSX protein XkdW [compost metagenome]